jgi:hypothetical protein
MSWKRIAGFAVGGALVALGAVVPGAGAALITAGVGIVSYNVTNLSDRKEIRRLKEKVGEK